jgi:hypothetical protein
VVILLTDGANNSGEMSPREAAEHAAALGVKVHTVLVGSPDGEMGGGGLFALRAPTDPALLEHIAARTGGMAFIATDKKSLENRFQRILDLMEKNRSSTGFGRLPAFRTAILRRPWFVSAGNASVADVAAEVAMTWKHAAHLVTWTHPFFWLALGCLLLVFASWFRGRFPPPGAGTGR